MAEHVQPRSEAAKMQALLALYLHGWPVIRGAETPPADGGGDPGQGGAADGGGLYDLNQFAPEIREQVEPAFKQFDANVTRKFQELNDRYKPWEPYAEMGLSEYDPEYVGQLLQFGETLQDEASFKDWLGKIVDEHGEALGVTRADAETDDLDDLGGYEGLTADQVKQIVAEQVQGAVAPLTQAQQKQEMERLQAEEVKRLDARLDELIEGAGLEGLDDETRDVVFTLAARHEGQADPVELGFKDFQAITGKAESGVLGAKARKPRAPEGAGGSPPAAPAERPTTFGEAKKMALERIAQSINA